MSVTDRRGCKSHLPRRALNVAEELADVISRLSDDDEHVWRVIAFSHLVFLAGWSVTDALKPFLPDSLVRDASVAEDTVLEPSEFWDTIRPWLDHARPQVRALRWRAMAMLSLRTSCGWTMRQMGQIWGHHKGHITRTTNNMKRRLRSQFQPVDAIVIDAEDRN